MFTLHDRRYKIDHRALIEIREKLGLKQYEFANMCGWSPQYQWRLENGYVESMTEATKNVIEDVIREME